jgi:hypothetical protein
MRKKRRKKNFCAYTQTKKGIHAKKKFCVHTRRAEILFTDHAKEEKEKNKKKISCAYTQSGDSIHGSCERREGKEKEKNLLCIHAELRFYIWIICMVTH